VSFCSSFFHTYAVLNGSDVLNFDGFCCPERHLWGGRPRELVGCCVFIYRWDLEVQCSWSLCTTSHMRPDSFWDFGT